MRDEGVICVAGHPWLNRRCTRLPGCIRLRNDLYCVGWGANSTRSVQREWLCCNCCLYYWLLCSFYCRPFCWRMCFLVWLRFLLRRRLMRCRFSLPRGIPSCQLLSFSVGNAPCKSSRLWSVALSFKPRLVDITVCWSISLHSRVAALRPTCSRFPTTDMYGWGMFEHC